jgi:hypothetical protein
VAPHAPEHVTDPGQFLDRRARVEGILDPYRASSGLVSLDVVE